MIQPQSFHFKEIVLENFKCHSSASMDFSKNKFMLVTGSNGSGKTSFIDAIAWALYDETTNGCKGDSVVKKRTGKNCCVTLTFNIDSDEYKIVKYRAHKTNGNKKFLFLNNVDISEPEIRDTNKKIESITMPKDIFFNCLLFSQFINKSFTSLGHGDQKSILDSMLSFDKYDKYKKLTSEKIKELENNLSALDIQKIQIDSQIESYLSLFKNQEDIHNEYINSTQKLIDNLTYGNTKLNEHLNLYIDRDIKSEIADCINKKTECLNYKSKIELKIDNLRDECKLEISEYRATQDSYKNQIKFELNNELNSENLSTSNDIDNSKQKLYELKSKYQTELSNLTDKFNSYKNELNSATQENINNIKNEINNLNKNQNKHNIENLNIQNELNQLNSIINLPEDICNSCNQPINNPELIEKRKTEIQTAKSKIKELNKKLNDINNTISLIDSKIQELIGAEKDLIDDLNSKTNNYKIEYDNNKNQLEALYSNEISNIQHNLDELNHKYNENSKKYNLKISNEIEKIDKETELKIEQIKNKYKSIADEFNNDIKRLESLIDDKNELYNSLQLKYEELDNLNKSIQENELKINLHEKNILNENIKFKHNKDNLDKFINDSNIKLKNIENDILDNNKNISILSFWNNAFGDSGIKSILLDEAIPILNDFALKLSSKTQNIRVSFDSQKILKSGDMRNKFEIRVDNTKNLSELSELSAGETRLANIIVLLSLRHLLEVMSGKSINILLLDEILDSLDEDNAMLAIEMIKELSSDYCVMLISHTLRNWIQADEEYNL